MKKKVQRLFTVLLVGLMVFNLMACGNSGGNESKSESKNETTTDTKGNTETQGTAANEETVDLTMAFVVFGTVPNDLQMVNDEINEYLKEKVNATITMVPINAGNYSQQIDLMLTSGEKLDLLADGTITAFFNYTSHASKGQLYPMNDLLDTYGQGIKEVMGDYINAAAVDGEVYGVASNRDLSACTSLIVRTSLLEKYNIDKDSIKTYEDIEAMLKTIKDNEATVTPLMIGSDASGTIFDSLGLSFGRDGDQLSDLIGVLMDNQVLTVENYYDTEACEEACALVRDWYQKGYILQDATTNQSTPSELMKAGTLFGYVTNSKPGIEIQTEASVGEPVTEIRLGNVLSDTQKVTGFMWSIANQCENPEKAMEVLNLMYTDPVLVNLLDHGIEGVHYQFVDEENQIIDYADGVTADNSGYDMNVDFQFGNQLMSYIWNGDSPQLWDEMKEFNDSATISKAMGFQFDTSKIKTEYAAVSAVIDQYKRSLGQGTVDYTTVLTEFREKLKTAGIDTIIAEKQAQLDAFIASQE